MKQYEGMFIFDPTFASDFKNVEDEVGRIMTRADGEIIVNRKWDERKLAYDIGKRKRGCYVLTYFKADPERIAALERDCGLSDHILRVMVLRADDMSRERMEAMYPQQASATPPAGEGASKPAPAPVAVADSAPTEAAVAKTEAAVVAPAEGEGVDKAADADAGPDVEASA